MNFIHINQSIRNNNIENDDIKTNIYYKEYKISLFQGAIQRQLESQQMINYKAYDSNNVTQLSENIANNADLANIHQH